MSSNKGPELSSSGIEKVTGENTKGRLQALKGELSHSKEVAPGERDVSWDKNYMGKYVNNISQLIRDIDKILGGGENGNRLEKFIQDKPEGKYTVEYYRDPMGGNDVYLLTANLKNGGSIQYTIPVAGRTEVTTRDTSGRPAATVEKILNP